MSAVLPDAGLVVAAVAGYLAWGLVEYGVHGILSHRFRTFVTRLHAEHHRDARAVFTSPVGWLPAAAFVFAVLVPLLGPILAGAAVGGLLLGFARYEWLHWRIHFQPPRSPRERLLRSHHLSHHRNPRAYHGVTTRLWDRVFGTLPDCWPEDYARAAERAPLDGVSNLAVVYSGAGLARALRRLTQPRTR